SPGHHDHRRPDFQPDPDSLYNASDLPGLRSSGSQVVAASLDGLSGGLRSPLDLAPQRLNFRHQSVEPCLQAWAPGMPSVPVPVPAMRVVSGSMAIRFVSGEMMFTGVMSRRVSMETVPFRVSIRATTVVAQMVITVVALGRDSVC